MAITMKINIPSLIHTLFPMGESYVTEEEHLRAFLLYLPAPNYTLTWGLNSLMIRHEPSKLQMEFASVVSWYDLIHGKAKEHWPAKTRYLLANKLAELESKVLQWGETHQYKEGVSVLPDGTTWANAAKTMAALPDTGTVSGQWTQMPVSGSTQIIPKTITPKGKVDLRDAVVLGQKVKGTSQTAVYRVVALHPNLKVAARLEEGRLHLRAEGPEIDELGKLKFTPKGDYASLHLQLGTIAPAQAVAALLAVMPVVFDQQVRNTVELNDALGLS